jgi:polysaccharide export outer membrane protein
LLELRKRKLNLEVETRIENRTFAALKTKYCMKYRFFILFLLGLFILAAPSCKTKEKLVYFQNGNLDSLGKVTSTFNPTFQTDDFLSIVVTAQEPESVIPFNLIPTLTLNSSNNGYATGVPASNGYLIDNAGNIQFPILGTLHLGGLNRQDAVELIQDKLKDYLKGPGVQIQILNYKITVLGDVKTPGTYKIPNERITLLEALGLSGDLNMTGLRNNILVIREENGQKKEYRVDITNKDFFASPVYYLHQNDVVYVEPNSTARTTSTLWRTTGTIFISLSSLIISTIILIVR